jgi:hypothetical protein
VWTGLILAQNKDQWRTPVRLSLEIIIMSRVWVTYKTGFGLDDWVYCTLYIHNSGLQAITVLSLFYTL